MELVFLCVFLRALKQYQQLLLRRNQMSCTPDRRIN